jgi:hypothetical protein
LAFFAAQVGADALSAYGKIYNSLDFIIRFYGGPEDCFTHGGAGILIPSGLMRRVGPALRKCARVFDIATVGSDMRLSLCVSRVSLKGEPIAVPHAAGQGFNADSPHTDRYQISTNRQITFHRIFNDDFDLLFGAIVTVLGDDRFIDWSPIALRSTSINGGASGRSYLAVFGHIICLGLVENTCLIARGGIEPARVEFANFSQEFASDFVVYLRCNGAIEEGELAYFAQPPPPAFGVILDARCPAPTVFPNRGKTPQKRITIEDEPLL